MGFALQRLKSLTDATRFVLRQLAKPLSHRRRRADGTTGSYEFFVPGGSLTLNRGKKFEFALEVDRDVAFAKAEKSICQKG